MKEPYNLFKTIRRSTFEELLTKYKSVTIHHENLQVLTIELYKGQ